MRIAIVDDEAVWQEQIRAELQNYFTHRGLEIDSYSSGKKFLQAEKNYDAIMMDVEMPGENGIHIGEIYKNNHENTVIIILTVHLEFCMDGYRTRALRFIDKTRMKEMLPSALEALELECSWEDEIQVHLSEGGNRYIPTGKISYAETDRHGVLIHMENETLRALNTITEIEEQLDGDSFFRSHKSYIVHWKYVKEIKDTYILMKDDSRAYISRRKLAEGKYNFMKYLFKTGKG